MIYQFNDISLDTRLLQLRNRGDPVAVEPQVFDLLLHLIENRDRVVTRDELLKNLWAGKVVGDASLSGCVKAVRKAVGDSGRAQEIIKTVHGRGYQFVAPVLKSTDGSGIPSKLGEIETNDLRETGTFLQRPSILVLPFANQSDDPQDEYFAVGITDEIRLDLCRFRDILVIARDSSMELKSTDPVQAARHLNVNYVLAGNIQRGGDKIRVSARLLNAASGEQAWAERYDREFKDAFEVQDELAQKIITILVGKIESESQERAMRKSVADLTAYDFLLKGNYYFNDWHASEEDTAIAEKMYTRATELEPEFAGAYVGLASVHVHRILYGFTDSPEKTGEAAIRLARKAVELDEYDSNARLVLAMANFHAKSNYDQATAQINIALELNPNNYQTYCFGGWICMCSGKLEEGVRCSSEAIRRNPLLPDGCLWTVGVTEYLVGHYDKAIQAFGRMLNPEPEVEACVAACYAQLGESEKAAISAAAFRRMIGKDLDEDVVRSRDYWAGAGMFDFKDPSRFEHLIDGLYKAGLIE